jgi:hypothetical protein
MAEQQKQVSIIPDFPRDPKMVDKEGNMTAAYALYFQQLNQALQSALTPEGFVFPEQTSTNIASLTSSTSVSSILYDSTHNQFRGCIFNPANNAANYTQEWDFFAMIVNNAGNPNSVVAGFVNLFCLDTTNAILYICTTAGNAATTVWTAVN